MITTRPLCTNRRAESFEVDAADHLSRNDVYVYFDALGDLICTDPSGTNVNDLIFLFANYRKSLGGSSRVGFLSSQINKAMPQNIAEKKRTNASHAGR